MQTKQYPLRMRTDLWEDLKRIQELDSRSANSLICEGIRGIISQKQMEISKLKKQRNSLNDMVSA